MIWTLIGGGPDASAMLELCAPTGPVATTNAGLAVYPTPHYYYVTDVVAREKFRPVYMEAKQRGTKIVTPRRNDPAMMRAADILIDCDPGLRADIYHPGKWTHPALSGCALAQFAANMGARTINLVGYDGYADGQPSSRFNGLQDAYLASVAASGVLLVRYRRGRIETIEPPPPSRPQCTRNQAVPSA